MGIDMGVVVMIVAVLGLGVVLAVMRSMRMPGEFIERQRTRDELRKALVAKRLELAKNRDEDEKSVTSTE